MKKVLFLAIVFLAFANLLNAQSLGNYSNTIVNEGSSINITPSAAPSGITALSAYSDNGSFTGSLTVSPTTGVITVVNPTGVGTYPIVVKSSNGVTKTFNLTVNPAYCAKKAYQGAASFNSVTPQTSVFSGTPAFSIFNSNTSWTNSGGTLTATYSDNADGTIRMSSNISLAGKTNPKLKFSQIVMTEAGYDFCRVEFSYDNGTSWYPFPNSYYKGSGTLATAASVNGTIAFDQNTYGQTSFDASQIRNESIDLSPFGALTTFRVRFRLTSDGSVVRAGWQISSIYFDSENTQSYGSAYPKNFAVGDFNKDGKKDVVISNQGSYNTYGGNFTQYGSLNVKLGDGYGGFGADNIILSGTQITAGYALSSTEVSDINADGNDDIVVILNGDLGQGGTSWIAVYLGNGAGGFASPIWCSAMPSAQELYIKDVNRDGYNDIIYKGLFNGSISVCVMLNTGSAQSPFNIDNATYTNIYAWGTNLVFDDFNRDGKVDFAFMGERGYNNYYSVYGHQLFVYHGSGTGSFSLAYKVTGQSSTALSNAGTAGSNFQLELTDINNDGRKDVIGVGEQDQNGSGLIYFFQATSFWQNSELILGLQLANVTGFPNTYAPYLRPLTNGTPLRIAAGDFNADGNNDIAIAVNSSSGVMGTSQYCVFYGNGTFYPDYYTALSTPLTSTNGRGTGSGKIISGDFDSDGRLDLLVSNPFSNNLSLIKTSGGLTNADISPISLTTPIAFNFNTGDMSASNICTTTGGVGLKSDVSGGYNPKYTWYRDGTPIGRNDSAYQYMTVWAPNPFLLLNQRNTGGFYVTAKNDNKTCPSLDTTVIAYSASTQVSFAPILTPTVTIGSTAQGLDVTYCTSNYYYFNASVNNGGSNPSGTWYLNGSPLSNTANTIISNNGLTINISGSYVSQFGGNPSLYCKVTPNGGCFWSSESGSTGIVTSNSFRFGSPYTYDRTLKLIPEGNISTLCSGSSYTFTAECKDCDASSIYTFFKSSNSYQQSTSKTFTTTLTENTTIYANATINACPNAYASSERLIAGSPTQPTSNGWISKADYGNEAIAGEAIYETIYGMQNGFSFVIGSKVYFGGASNSYSGGQNFWSWDARTGVRKTHYSAPLPLLCNAGIAFASSGKGYVLFGVNGSQTGFLGAFWEYDPATDIWTNKSSALIGTDLLYSAGMASFTVNDFGYVGGGYYGTSSTVITGPSTKWYKYDPINNQFYSIADCAVSGMTSKKGVAFSAASKGFFLKDAQLWKYDPSADSWSNTNKGFPNASAYYDLSAFNIGNYGYIGGGIPSGGGASFQKNFYEFNGLTESYTAGAITSFPLAGISGATGFSIANKGYILGGLCNSCGDGRNKNLYEFTPQYSQKTVFTYGLTSTNLCKGSTLSIKYDGGCSGTYPSDNIFTAELSDKNGIFSNPTVIGSITSSALRGTITVTIPSNISSGTRYRIRVNASAPKTIGLDNGLDIIIDIPASPGSISHDYSIPYPTELIVDSVKNTASVLGAINGYFWQKSSDTTNASGWRSVTDTATSRSNFILPTNYNNDVFLRRGVVLGCLTTVYTNPVSIRVYSSANGRLNGSISGSVKSSNGVGVYGVPIFAQKRSALLGSPQSKIYQTTTDISGAYIIPNVFYGDLNNGDSTSAIFKVWPTLANHGFMPDTLLAELSNVIYTATDKNFTDTSTYSVRGKVMQYCSDCDPGYQSDSLNGIQINITKGTLSYPSGTTGSDGYGRYGVTFTDPGSYKFVPSKTGNTFTPVERTVNIVNANLSGIDFTNTTRYNISGLFRAGANEVIGTATLEFSDTMMPARFKKTITTNANGSYSVSLPARTYNIRVIDFSPNTAGNDISTNDLITWFNTTIKDSLQKISIDGSSKTVDLIYHRAPKLYLENLPDTSCGNYVVFKQDASRPFKIKVYEGDSSHRALLSYDTLSSIEVVTNVQVSSTLQTLSTKPVNGVSNVALTGGAPNIAGDHLKQLFVDFEDMYGRRATRLQRNAVVLGLKSDPSTFTTVSPSVPILILHAPPGDQSISFWEQNKTTETAMSFSSLSDKSTNKWADVKVGTEFTAGIGFTVETSIWANVNTSITNSQRVTNAREAILSSSTSVAYATEPNGGDVYVGGAINLAYAISNELLFRSDTTVGCVLGLKSSLAIAPKGFATTYTYSESFITDNLIPRLELQASMSPDSTARKLTNQISIWQQVIANNNANKDRAEFVRNRSFDGNAGPITESTTSTSTNTNTIAFEMEIDKNVAIQAGVEIGGIGVSGGATIDMKMTTGNSTTNTATTSTTMGYTLDDDDAGDFYSVDIKKDPVYNTPVFVLVAGTASCPAEPIAQSRDNVQLTIPTPEIRNIPANGEALFQLQLQNISESRETRTCYLTFNQSSNPNGALVTIGGSPVTSNISYTIPYLGSQIVTVSVKKSNASPVFSYEGLQFTMSDACDGGVSESKTISAYFISPCSDLILNAPVNNWVVKSSDNNILPVSFTGYNLSNLQSVALEYAHAGRGDWATDTILYQNFITNPTTSVLNWNTRRLVDGEYDIRMKLNCSFGSGYTQRLTGIIDREAPILFGLPKPTSGTYANGDEISMSYTENITTADLNTNKVKMTRLSNGADIPVQVSGYQNKVMMVPLVNINAFASGEAIRVITKNIADVYGNTSVVADTFVFTIGTAVPTATTRQVKVSNLITSKRSVYENSGDSLQVRFSVPTASTFNTVVHYVVSGSAVFANDYNNSFSTGQNLTTTFNGVEGTINIPANATWAVLNIKPMADDDIETNETVNIRLLSGGDYTLGVDSVSTITDTIKNDDLNKPEITMGDMPTIYPTGYCQTVIDSAGAKTYVWNVPTTLPVGYCGVAVDPNLTRANSANVLPTGYCFSSAYSMGDEQILGVSFGTMNNDQYGIENCFTNYTDYSSSVTPPVVNLGESIPFSVITDECDGYPYYQSGLAVFIDYNRDGDFDDYNERAYSSNNVTMSPNTQSGDIVIPYDALAGITKMRVVVTEGNYAPNACSWFGYGEVEDYAIMINGDGSSISNNVLDDEQIKAVSFGTMNNIESDDDCSVNYTDYTTSVAAPIVTTGQYIPISVLIDECDGAPYNQSGVSVYIDYNRDGYFDDYSERAYSTWGTRTSPTTVYGNVYIPTNAALGLTKMRVVVQDGVEIPGSCVTLGYGEVEDYAIMIHNVPPVLTVFDDEQIKSVSFGTMNNVESDSCSANYTDYSKTVAAPVVMTGQSVPFSVLTDECDNAPYYASGMSVFIDYNRDGDFEDAEEKVYTSNGTTMSPNTRSGNIVIPANASLGLTKMRIIVAEGVASPNACDYINYGEVEDYGVMIKRGTAPTICQGGTGILSGPSAVDGSPVYLYVWKLNGTTLSANTQTISINAAGTYSLKVYTNNGFSSISMPYVVTATAPPTSNEFVTVCPIELPYLWNGVNYNTSGVYSKTVSNANGCDSIARLHLTVKLNSYAVETFTAIDTFEWHGTVYNTSTTSATWTGTNEAGCDSIVTLNLTIIPICVPVVNEYYIIACNSYTWHGIRFTTSMTGVEWTTQNARGCDSTEILNLTIKRSTTSTTNVSICATQAPYTWNGVAYSATGTYSKKFVNAIGCDSTAKLVLTVKSTTSSLIKLSVCANDMPYTWNGETYPTAGTYTQTLTNAAGCDSIASIQIKILPVSNSNNYLSVCSNQLPFVWNGLYLTESGTYSASFNNVNGCDSTAMLNLTVKQVSSSVETISATGSSYTWHGTEFTESNQNATWTGTNAAGCDSVVTLNLNLNTNCVPTQQVFNVIACNSYTWHGILSTTSTTLQWVGVNAGGCDSVEILNLTITTVSPTAPPSSITQVLVSNVCGARVYRYTAATTTNATGYAWTLPISAGGIPGVVVDSGDAGNSRVIKVRYASKLAAFATDSVRVKAFTTCGYTANRAAKLINTLYTVPVAPASITITPLVTNICGAKLYRYTAPALPAASATNVAATGYLWSFTGVLSATDSITLGTDTSRIIEVLYRNNAAAVTGDSIRLLYSSSCGNSNNKSVKLANTLLSPPVAPTVTVATVVSNVCGARKYRYTASAKTIATTTTGAATGWLWSLPEGPNGSTGSIDSGDVSSQTIVVKYTSNAAAVSGDSIRVRYTSDCGVGIVKATKLTNTLLSVTTAPSAITITPVVAVTCGHKVYRYSAPDLIASTATTPATTGYTWSFVGTLSGNPFGGDTTKVVIDSGNVNSRVILVRFKTSTAASTGDSIRVVYTSVCGEGPKKAAKLTNVNTAATTAPAIPASITITAVTPNVCGSRVYRYAAPALPAATTTATAATGYAWSFTGSLSGNPFADTTKAVVDSGSINSRTILVRFKTNVAANTGDSVKLSYTSTCGNSAAKASKLTNTSYLPAAPATLTAVLVSDNCGSRVYRYTASALISATSTSPSTIGYDWSFTGTLGANAVIDSGNGTNVVKVRFTSNAAASLADSVKVRYTSECGSGSFKGIKLINVIKLCSVPVSFIKSTQKETDIKQTASSAMEVKVYPNPSSSNFNLKVTSDSKEKIDARVMDVQGRLIKRMSFDANETILFGNELTPGVYMIKLKEGKDEKSVRVVKY